MMTSLRDLVSYPAYISILVLISAGYKSAQAQTPAGMRLPSVIEGCYTATPSTPNFPKVCILWFRDGNSYSSTSQDFSAGVTQEVRFDRSDSRGFAFTVTTKPDQRIVRKYIGTVTGDRFEGKIIQTITIAGPPVSAEYGWSGWIFYPPDPAARSNQYAFVACADQTSIINLGDHSVTTIDLKMGQFYAPQSLAVSPEGTKAFISSNGQTPKWYPAKLLTLDASTGSVTKVVSLASSPVPSGFTSLAMAGDGVTLYGSGQNVKQNGAVIMAMDAVTGTTIATTAYQAPDPAHANSHLVMAGNKVVLGDGSVPDVPAPKGGLAAFGSDAQGLSAFPDGQNICSGGKVVAIGTQTVSANKPCAAISPNGSQTYGTSPGPSVRSPAMTLLGRIQFASDRFTPMTGITPDGKTLFKLQSTLAGQRIFAIAPVSGLATDVIPVCAQPTLLGMPPLTR